MEEEEQLFSYLIWCIIDSYMKEEEPAFSQYYKIILSFSLRTRESANVNIGADIA